MARWLALLSTLPMTTGCFNGILLRPMHFSEPVEEVVMERSDHLLCRHKIAVIDVEGMLLNARSSGLLGDGDNPVSLFRERLQAAADDPRVRAVVLRLNTPGGSVTASDMMYKDLLAFREKTGIPVVACMMDVAASGGYYLAMACDYVYAHPTTVTGSIGVIMNMYNAAGLAGLVGVTSNPIKSGPIKDIGNPLRPMTDVEREILQGIVDRFYDQFVAVVCGGRRLPEEQVRALADGRIYTGLQAKELGLVDDVGYLPDALATAQQLAGIRHATVVAYDRGSGYRGSIYAGGLQVPSNINVRLDLPGLNAVNAPANAGFMYLWQAGVAR